MKESTWIVYHKEDLKKEYRDSTSPLSGSLGLRPDNVVPTQHDINMEGSHTVIGSQTGRLLTHHNGISESEIFQGVILGDLGTIYRGISLSGQEKAFYIARETNTKDYHTLVQKLNDELLK